MAERTNQPDEGPRRLEDEFYCRARRRRVTLDKCLNDYLDANAFNDRRAACWRCPQGRRHRENYSRSR